MRRLPPPDNLADRDGKVNSAQLRRVWLCANQLVEEMEELGRKSSGSPVGRIITSLKFARAMRDDLNKLYEAWFMGDGK